jgi:hypothetical protein
LEMGSWELFAQVGFKPGSSHLSLLG